MTPGPYHGPSPVWHQRRVWKAETALLEARLQTCEEYDKEWGDKTPDQRIGDAFNDGLEKLNILSRLGSRLARDYPLALQTRALIRKLKNEPRLATSYSPLATSSGDNQTPKVENREVGPAPLPRERPEREVLCFSRAG